MRMISCGRDAAGIGFVETETSQVDDRAAEQDGEERPPGGRSKPHAGRREHLTKHIDPPLQMTAHEELRGRPAAVLQFAGRGCSSACGEIRLRRLGAPARVAESVAEFGAKVPLLRRVFRLEFQGEPVEAGCPFEPQRRGGLVRAGGRVEGGFGAISRPVEVDCQHFRIRPRRGFERIGQPGMAASQDLRSQLRADRFANAIVISLDFLHIARRSHAHQAPPAQRGHDFVIGALVARGRFCQLQLDGLSGDCDHLQQTPRSVAQPRDTGLNHLVQGGSPGRRFRRARQLADEQRIACGIPGDRFRPRQSELFAPGDGHG